MTRRAEFVAAATAAAVLAFAAPPSRTVFAADALARPTTVILVRHAEKNEHPPGGDKGLTTKGLVRAQTLARTLRDAGVAAVFSSQYGRARMTAEPLAKALGDSVHVYDANDIPALAKRIRDEYAGRTVVVVGHGDSVPVTIAELGGPALKKGEPVAYDRLFVLTLETGSEPRLLRLNYGDVAE